MTKTYYPKGVCARCMEIELEDSVIKSVTIAGGCHGNSQGITALVKGQKAEDVIERLEGIDCRGRGTSCPDQLAKALKEIMKEKE